MAWLCATRLQIRRAGGTQRAAGVEQGPVCGLAGLLLAPGAQSSPNAIGCMLEAVGGRWTPEVCSCPGKCC